jgi:hypothetical protein
MPANCQIRHLINQAIALLLLILPLLACSMTKPDPVKTVDGPEASDLASRVSGYVLMSEPVGGIIGVKLPTLEKIIVRAPDKGAWPVIALGGPDTVGRIVFIEQNVANKIDDFTLKTIKVDGSDEQLILSRTGKNSPLGDDVALSVDGRQAAFVGNTEGVQLSKAYVEVGQLEIVDLTSKSPKQTGIKAYKGRVSWFPDGERLAYLELIPKQQLEPKLLADVEKEDLYYKEWEQMPVVHILEVKTGKKTLLGIGDDPLVSPDGKSVLVDGYRLIEVASGAWKPVRWPGKRGAAFALLGADLLIYRAVPTTGSKPEYRGTSMGGWEQLLPLKLGDARTGKFLTLVPYTNQHTDITFGAIQK